MKLIEIQTELKAPKNQFNSFGKYKYRNCEDILEAVKPLLQKYNCLLTITDEVKEANGVMFIESSATLTDLKTKEAVCVKAQAGIDVNRKGMDVSQSFGASSSYARKYALNGLFLIDDTKDADATNDHKPKKAIATESTIKAMLKAIQDGQIDIVKERAKDYDLTPEQIKTLGL